MRFALCSMLNAVLSFDSAFRNQHSAFGMADFVMDDSGDFE